MISYKLSDHANWEVHSSLRSTTGYRIVRIFRQVRVAFTQKTVAMKPMDLNLEYLTFLGINVRQSKSISGMQVLRYTFFMIGIVFGVGIFGIGHFIMHFTSIASSANYLIVTAALIACLTSYLSFTLKARAVHLLCKEFEMIATRGSKSYTQLIHFNDWPWIEFKANRFLWNWAHSERNGRLPYIRACWTSWTPIHKVHCLDRNDWDFF